MKMAKKSERGRSGRTGDLVGRPDKRKRASFVIAYVEHAGESEMPNHGVEMAATAEEAVKAWLKEWDDALTATLDAVGNVTLRDEGGVEEDIAFGGDGGFVDSIRVSRGETCQLCKGRGHTGKVSA